MTRDATTVPVYIAKSLGSWGLLAMILQLQDHLQVQGILLCGEMSLSKPLGSKLNAWLRRALGRDFQCDVSHHGGHLGKVSLQGS